MREFEWQGPQSPYAAEAGELGVLLDEIAEAERRINELAAEQVLRVAEFSERRRVFDRRAFPGWASESETPAAVRLRRRPTTSPTAGIWSRACRG